MARGKFRIRVHIDLAQLEAPRHLRARDLALEILAQPAAGRRVEHQRDRARAPAIEEGRHGREDSARPQRLPSGSALRHTLEAMNAPVSLPAVDVRGLVRSYRHGFLGRSRVALHGLDLAIASGEFVGLVGPNGSGKSTLLRVLAAVDEPDSGQVRVFGADPDSREARRATGFCPEDSPYPTDVRARDVLALLGSLRRMERAACARRSAELLERVGLAHVARERLGGFSRGMLRRFCIAAALLHEPKLLLLDEPTAGLDAPGFAAIESLLDEARARGTTLMISSHLLSDLHQRCERLVALVDGRIVAQGDAHALAASLGSAARLELCFEGLDAEAIGELRRVAEARGARLVGVQPAQSNLVELYRRSAAARKP